MMKSIINKVVYYVGHVFYPIKNERGATAVEYALMVALIAAVIIVAVTLIGTNVTSVFNNVAAKIKSV